MKIRQALLAMTVIAATGVAHGADLLTVYQQAQQNDATYLAALQAYKAAEQNSPIARSTLLPQVNLSANSTNDHTQLKDFNYGGTPIPDRTYDYNQKGYTVSLSQTLFNYADWAAYRQAGKTVAQARATLESARQSLVLRVATAYFNVLGQGDKLSFSLAQQRANERLLEQAKQRFDVGLTAITDVKQAQASYDLSRAQTLQAQNDLDNAQEDLAVITGQTYEQLNPLAQEVPLLHPEPNVMEQWVNAALKQNPGVLAARYASEAAQDAVSQARAGHYPTLDLVASRNYNDADGGFQSGKTTTDAIGVQLNLPIFSGLGTSARTDQAQAQFQQAQEQLKGAERSTSRDTRSAFLGVDYAINQVHALNQAVISNQASVDATEAGFKVGTRTSLDVLTAISDLYSAESNYALARYTYLLNTLKLKDAAGTLSVTDLTQINGYLSTQPRKLTPVEPGATTGTGDTTMPAMEQGGMKQ